MNLLKSFSLEHFRQFKSKVFFYHNENILIIVTMTDRVVGVRQEGESDQESQERF